MDTVDLRVLACRYRLGYHELKDCYQCRCGAWLHWLVAWGEPVRFTSYVGKTEVWNEKPTQLSR